MRILTKHIHRKAFSPPQPRPPAAPPVSQREPLRFWLVVVITAMPMTLLAGLILVHRWPSSSVALDPSLRLPSAPVFSAATPDSSVLSQPPLLTPAAKPQPVVIVPPESPSGQDSAGSGGAISFLNPTPEPRGQTGVRVEPLPQSNWAIKPPQSTTVRSSYGHFAYAEHDTNTLVKAGDYYDRTELLAPEAADAFWQMQQDAATQGISLSIISGFRTISEQAALFERQIQRQGSREMAAQLSAPPGHSEHHTGYALDIGDGDVPAADLKFEFEDTPAYQWLLANAQRYGFELSFPPNNTQGVSFEPWHWRYINSPGAQSTFVGTQP